MTAFSNVSVLVATGDLISVEQWQSIYRLPVGSDKIGKFFSLKEDRFQRDIKEFGVLIVNAPLMMVMDEARRLLGKPLNCSSYNRNEAKQKELLQDPSAAGLRAVVSPHVAKMAVDLDFITREDVQAALPIIRQAAKNMNIRIRIGHKAYAAKSLEVEKSTGEKNKWTFIHLDVCPEFYAKGMSFFYIPHPESWEREIEW